MISIRCNYVIISYRNATWHQHIRRYDVTGMITISKDSFCDIKGRDQIVKMMSEEAMDGLCGGIHSI